ncbi:hypothetical protein EFY79_19770 [Hanamia caeni]|uniref:Peptidase C39-like domain-containing protein n=1 Tax=Hanamia caeni TaxID=2294116 RepID=A0A3M9N4X4_9BACT|nr:C39 family peptidase [Hanamia caeni]RNI32832.1 hypothetical protein EFY79_19770 [Hanamia caeni]
MFSYHLTKNYKIFFLLLLFYNISKFASGQEKTLDIPPVYQQTPEWCWVSCGEMIFKYYDICSINPANNFQCGIIALIGPACNNNCFSCPLPAGSTQTIINMLARYPYYAHNICGSSKTTIGCIDVFGQCSESTIIANIDNDMPIIAGISPAGGGMGLEAAHVVLIVGYDLNQDGTYVIINDPFPYSRLRMTDPYTFYGGQLVEDGQYKMKFSTFTSNFRWNRSLISIR